MEHHRDTIFSTSDSTLVNWTARFNSLRQATTTSKEAVEMEALKANATRLQTPGKRSSKTNGEDWEEILEVYEEAWKELAFEKTLTFPDSFKVSELMLATANRTAEIEEAVKEVIEDGQDEKSWMTRELNGVALRTTDLEFFLGDPIGESASVWTAVSALTTEVSDNSIESVGRFSAVNVAFEQMFGAVTGFQERYKEKFQTLEHRIDGVEFGGVSVEADSLEVSSLKLRVEDLSKQGVVDRVRIDSFESRLASSDMVSVVIGEHSEKGPTVLRSSEDLRSYIAMSGWLATDLNFGGFGDVYVLLLRLEARRSDTPSMLNMLKSHKDVRSLNISLDEAMVIHSHLSLVHAVFNRVLGKIDLL